jgi:hypothetical protein
MFEFGLTDSRRIFYAGECVKFFFRSSEPFAEGKAFLRTNIGMSAVRRREIIDEVEKNQRCLGIFAVESEVSDYYEAYRISLFNNAVNYGLRVLRYWFILKYKLVILHT